MKNLLQHTDSFDKLEELPSREKFHDYSWDNDSYWGKNFPYRRIRRWIESQEGINIDLVIHKFVNLKWLLPIYRTLDQLRREVEVNTFMENGNVCYYSRYMSYWRNTQTPYSIVKDELTKTIYVHPETKLICVHRPPTKRSWDKIEGDKLSKRLVIIGDYHQLYKLNGIWYEIKATPFAMDISPFITHPYKRKGPRDVLMEKNSSFKRDNHTSPYVRITFKRQLNHKELKKHGLHNDIASSTREKCKICGAYTCKLIHSNFKVDSLTEL